MHAKLDELIKATYRARDELAGIEEELEEDQVRELRGEAKQAARQTNEIAEGEKAKRAIEEVGDGKWYHFVTPDSIRHPAYFGTNRKKRDPGSSPG